MHCAVGKQKVNIVLSKELLSLFMLLNKPLSHLVSHTKSVCKYAHFHESFAASFTCSYAITACQMEFTDPKEVITLLSLHTLITCFPCTFHNFFKKPLFSPFFLLLHFLGFLFLFFADYSKVFFTC